MADPKDSPSKVASDTQKAADKQESKDAKAATGDAKGSATGASASDEQAVSFNADSNSGQLGRNTGTTKAQSDELDELGVNPMLDNRTGDQRPTLDPDLKPQQIDGPEIGGLAVDASELADKGRPKGRKGNFQALGSKSEGPIGRGEDVASEGVPLVDGMPGTSPKE